MANPEHLAILKKGVEAWNEWREENPHAIPLLSSVDLRGMVLRKVNLKRAYLDYSRLERADLEGATLGGANLVRAKLSDADLRSANLIRADLSGADLTGANLEGAVLSTAKLLSANLTKANLSSCMLDHTALIKADLAQADLANATMGCTTFADTDLSGAKGLDTVKHHGPSTIDIETVHRSGGEIPEAFLQGIGLPDVFITSVKSVAGQPTHFYSCFISYSRKDAEFAQQLHGDLQSRGVRCWFDEEDLKIGDRIRPRIDESIRAYDKLLLVLSSNSVSSTWVETEVEMAFEKERKQERTVLFPIRVDESVMETEKAWASGIRQTRHIGDFTDWKNHDSYKMAFDRLLRDLRGEKKAR